MIEREIIDAYTMVHPDDVERWTIVTSNPDGTLWPYLFPTYALEAAAVEYGLPADDFDALLRWVMLDCHVDQPRSVANDPAARAGHLHKGRPVWLGNAASTDQAREAHAARIDWVEQHMVRIVGPTKGAKRMMRPLDLDTENDVEIDAHARLASLRASYTPDHTRMAKQRAALRATLGRDI